MCEGKVFVDKLKLSIYNASQPVSSMDSGSISCRLWLGARWADSEYGKKSLQLPGSKSKKCVRVHRLVYSLYTLNMNDMPQNITEELLDPPHTDSTGTRLDVSHLCHQPLCVNPEHLVLEPHRINILRITCQKQGKCTGDHSPTCIF